MFTGIVQALGTIASVRNGGGGAALSISIPKSMRLKEGWSVAVNGVCLTARDIKGSKITCDCMPETLRLTNLGELKPGDRVNLETPLSLGKPLGGHLVQGHVDGVGSVLSVKPEGNAKIFRVAAPADLNRYFIKKGSVAVDGVSLTVTETYRNGFSVSLIPVTLRDTTLGRKGRGATVNIEVDMLAKYVEKLVTRL